MSSVELVGKKAVADYIRLSEKTYLELYRVNDQPSTTAPIYEFEGQSSNNTAAQFLKWADLNEANGQNFNVYKIVLSNGIPPDENKDKAAAKKRWSSMVSTFVLNAQGTGIGMPVKQADGTVVFYTPPAQVAAAAPPDKDLTGMMTKADFDQALAHAMVNIQKDMEISRLNSENLELSRRLRDLEQEVYGEDDEDEDDEDDDGILSGQKWTPDTVRGILGDVKDFYLQSKGIKPDSKEKLNKVAAPETEETIITIPADAVEGSFPPFVTITEENKDRVHKDQQIKMNAVIKRLYAKDAHLADDLNIIANIAEKKPNRFQGLIASLREE